MVDSDDEVLIVHLCYLAASADGPDNLLELRSCIAGEEGNSGDGVTFDDEELESLELDARFSFSKIKIYRGLQIKRINRIYRKYRIKFK